MSFEKSFMKHNQDVLKYGREGCAYVHAETEDHECALVFGGEGIELLLICVRLIGRLAEQSDVSFDDTCELLKGLHESCEEVVNNVRN